MLCLGFIEIFCRNWDIRVENSGHSRNIVEFEMNSYYAQYLERWTKEGGVSFDIGKLIRSKVTSFFSFEVLEWL